MTANSRPVRAWGSGAGWFAGLCGLVGRGGRAPGGVGEGPGGPGVWGWWGGGAGGGGGPRGGDRWRGCRGSGRPASGPGCRISPGAHSPSGEVLGQGVAQAHEHAALDLALDGGGVDHLAGVVGRVDLLDPALVVQHHHVGGKAVGDVALGVGLVGAQLVGGVEELGKVLLALQGGEVAARLVQVAFEVSGGHAHGLAGDEGLAGAGGGAGVGEPARSWLPMFSHLQAAGPVVWESPEEDGGAALADVGGGGVELHHALRTSRRQRPLSGQAHAHAGVLHGAGDARVALLAS